MPIDISTCDVLIAGSGLAGLRAGISALEEDPRLSVLMVTGGKGPSGSSFTNVNDSLGMVVCRDEREAGIFLETAVSIAPPGTMNPGLAEILAFESLDMFNDLLEMGFRFREHGDGRVLRFPCCFLPDPPLASVFTGLSHAFSTMFNRFQRLGGKVVQGFILKDVVQDLSQKVEGALFTDRRLETSLAVQARSLVLSTGGAAGLFERSLSGKGCLGFGSALMARLGAAFVNASFVQFLWYDVKTMEYFPCHSIGEPGVHVVDRSGNGEPVPKDIRERCLPRSRHVPAAHSLDDSAVDAFLVERLGPDGTIRVCSPQGTRIVAPFAHAVNGGMAVDSQAGTTVKGVFACGECAGGMHGANRVGGAMVLSTQVFGKRAGIHAARHANGTSGAMLPSRFMAAATEKEKKLHRNDGDYRRTLTDIQMALRPLQGPWQPEKPSGPMKALAGIREKAEDWRSKLAVESSLIIAGFQRLPYPIKEKSHAC